MSPLEKDNLSEADAAIAAAKLALPQLCAHGMNPTRAGRCDNLTIEGLNSALEFLKQCRKTQKPNRSSYGLKHDVERWRRCYIANGELIIAAVFLGFPYHWSGNSPNVLIGVSTRDVQQVSALRQRNESNRVEQDTGGESQSHRSHTGELNDDSKHTA